MQIIWEAMHQDGRWLLTRILLHVNAILISLYEGFRIVHCLLRMNTVPAGSIIQCISSGIFSNSSQVSIPCVFRYLVASSTSDVFNSNQVSECV